MRAHPRSGSLVSVSTTGERVYAFLPRPLPPGPDLSLSQEDHGQIARANLALGRLDGLAMLLPDTALFVYFYVRKEAVLSSQIEGTQSSLADLLHFESEHAPGVPLDDVQEVSNYVAAIQHSLKRVRDGLPLSVRLLKETHEILLSKGRGEQKQPGEFRRSQNWIGGTRPGNAAFVPPPPHEVQACMSALEAFMNGVPVRVPVLLRAALSHVQFETIHPFLDGNGRLGRLLIPLMLCAEGTLQEPILYLSLFFKTHREEYYRRLQAVREEGDWEGWVRFFMEGVVQTSEQAVQAARQILALFERDQKSITALGRPASTALRVHDSLKRHPVASVAQVTHACGLSKPAAAASLRHLIDLGLVREITGQRRGRLFVYQPYLDLLHKGVALPSA